MQAVIFQFNCGPYHPPWPRGGGSAWVQLQPGSPPSCLEAPGSTAAWVTAVLPGGSGFIGTAVWTSVR